MLSNTLYSVLVYKQEVRCMDFCMGGVQPGQRGGGRGERRGDTGGWLALPLIRVGCRLGPGPAGESGRGGQEVGCTAPTLIRVGRQIRGWATWGQGPWEVRGVPNRGPDWGGWLPQCASQRPVILSFLLLAFYIDHPYIITSMRAGVELLDMYFMALTKNWNIVKTTFSFPPCIIGESTLSGNSSWDGTHTLPLLCQSGLFQWSRHEWAFPFSKHKFETITATVTIIPS